MNHLRPTIDLTRYHAKSTHGEFVLYQTWVFNADQEEYEPALVIIPSNRRSGFQPCVVALSAAFKYDSPKYCVEASRLFVRALGMEDGITRAFTIGTLIYDHLDDLLKMPLSPTTSIIVGEATIDTGHGKQILLIEDYEPTKQL